MKRARFMQDAPDSNTRGPVPGRTHVWGTALLAVALVGGVAAVTVVTSGAAVATTGISECTTIDQSGAYELTADIEGSDTCIEVTASDVHLEGNGYSVTGVNSPSGSGIVVNGTDAGGIENVTVENVTVADWVDGFGVHYIEADNGTIRNATALESGSIGIYVEGSDNIVVQENTVTDSGESGIRIESGSRNATVSDNVVSGSDTIAVWLRSVDNSTVDDNVVNDTTDAGIVLGAGMSESSVHNNTVANNTGGIVELGDTSDNTLTNNTVRDNSGPGIALLVFVSGAPSGTVVEGNRVLDNQDGIELDEATGVELTDTVVRGSSGWSLIAKNDATATVEDLDIGNSTAANTTLSFDARNVTLSPATDPPDPPADNASLGRYFVAEETSAGTGELTNLELAYETADTDGVVEETLSLWRHDGDWTELDGSGVDTAANVVTANVTAFSTFGAFGAEPTAVLQINAFADQFPDTEDGAYGQVAIPVEELDGVETQNLEVTLVIDGGEAGEVFNETRSDRELDGEEDEFVFSVGDLATGEEYTATVTVDADNADAVTDTETFLAAVPATPVLSDLQIATDGDEATITTGDEEPVAVTVENAGEFAGEFTVELSIENGATETEQSLTAELDPAEEETVTFEDVTGDLPAGKYTVTVSAGEAELTGTLSVQAVVPETASPPTGTNSTTGTDDGDESSVSIESVTAAVTVRQGEEAVIETTLHNGGDEATTRTVTFEVNPEETREVTLDAGETETVTFTVDTTDITPGEYTYTIRVDEDERSGTLTVEEAEATPTPTPETTPTPTPETTPTQEATSTPETTPTPTPEGTVTSTPTPETTLAPDADDDGPGFGVVAGVLAVLSATVVAFRRRH